MENPQATVTSHGNASNSPHRLARRGRWPLQLRLSPLARRASTAARERPQPHAARLPTTPSTRRPISSLSWFSSPASDTTRYSACTAAFVTVFSPAKTYPQLHFAVTRRHRVLANASEAYNSSKNGGGIGANARWSFYNKRVDFGLHALGGSGVGRYGFSGLADSSVHANGTLDLIRSFQGLGTLEWHGPKLDVYFNAGAEYASRAASFDPILGKAVGYGSPSFNNTGCFTETGPGAGGFLPGGLSSCTADTRVLMEGTAGFWYKLYDGSKEKVNKGRVQFGPQFSYVTRNAWSGSSSPNEPHGIDTMIFTSFRYYLP